MAARLPSNKEQTPQSVWLLSVPRVPNELPMSATIRNAHDIPEWKLLAKK